MNVDKFGHHLLKRQKCEDVVFIHSNNVRNTKDGNPDSCEKILKNLPSPTDDKDAATKEYVDQHIDHCIKTYKTLNESVNNLVTRLAKLEKSFETRRLK